MNIARDVLKRFSRLAAGLGHSEIYSDMHLKGALHVHTTCSDGELGIAETIRVLRRTGI